MSSITTSGFSDSEKVNLDWGQDLTQEESFLILWLWTSVFLFELLWLPIIFPIVHSMYISKYICVPDVYF